MEIKITAQIKIYPVRRVHLYQKYSQKAKELRLLGMSNQQIAKSLNISKIKLQLMLVNIKNKSLMDNINLLQ